MYIWFLLLIHVICYDLVGSMCRKRDWTSLVLVHLNTKILVYSGCSVMNELARIMYALIQAMVQMRMNIKRLVFQPSH